MTELPLFPLSSVLFPGGRISLQIFEQRYLDLVRSCLKQDSGFGLVMISEGQEVARPGAELPALAQIGCHARIVDWDSLPNGLLGITIQGDERFVLHSAESQASQLVVGQVDMLEDYPAEAMREEWSSLLDVLCSLEAHPHVKRLGYAVDHEDAWQVGCALAQLLPVEEELKYDLLAESDIVVFMEELDELLNELGGLTA